MVDDFLKKFWKSHTFEPIKRETSREFFWGLNMIHISDDSGTVDSPAGGDCDGKGRVPGVTE